MTLTLRWQLWTTKPDGHRRPYRHRLGPAHRLTATTRYQGPAYDTLSSADPASVGAQNGADARSVSDRRRSPSVRSRRSMRCRSSFRGQRLVERRQQSADCSADLTGSALRLSRSAASARRQMRCTWMPDRR